MKQFSWSARTISMQYFGSISCHHLVAKIRVTITAEVWAGVICTNVLADNTTTCLALALVLLRLLDLPTIEHIVLRADELH